MSRRCTTIWLACGVSAAGVGCGRPTSVGGDCQGLPGMYLSDPRVAPVSGTLASGITVVGRDRFAVGRTDSISVVVLDGQGKVLAEVGRQGMGPGELQSIAAVAATSDGLLAVADVRGSRVVWYDREHRSSSEISLPGQPIGLVGIDSSKVVAVITPRGPAGRRLLELKYRSEVTEPFGDGSYLRELIEGSGDDQSRLFLGVAAKQGEILIGSPTVYRLSSLRRDGEGAVFLERPDLKPQYPDSATIAHREQAFARVTAGRPAVPPAVQEAVRKRMRETPDPYFSLHGIAVDPQERTWIATGRRASDSTVVDVYSPRGSLLGSLCLRDDVLGLAVTRSTVAAVVERSDDRVELPALDLYPIQ